MTAQRLLVAGVFVLALHAGGGVVAAEPIGIRSAADRDGAPVTITYSFSNLLDGTFLVITPWEMRAAAQEALRLWASYAPLHFVERPDSGPASSDVPYPAADHPMIRIGHHPMLDIGHSFVPDGSDNGLSGDVHFDSGIPWTLGSGRWDFLETITHELGHSLGLGHVTEEIAIMNPSYPQRRFHGLGSAFLFPADIRAIRALYGSGTGRVEPLAADPVPEPATIFLVLGGIGGLAACRRSRRRHGRPRVH
jgi:hypothetical protein